ncbi:MAG: sugar ABC transporter ATP-binding protein [Thermoleophilia bacterium]|nr:sugar ABC transporter ATP-binding protein [Thermoleophilia bacterium]
MADPLTKSMGDSSVEDAAVPFPVELRDVGKRFGETIALDDVSLEGKAGEIHAIVGENGSGKSTLVKLMAGVHRPNRGEVLVFGGSVGSFGPAQMQELGLVAVFQEVLVAEGASVLDNIFVGYDGLFRARLSRAEKAARATEILGRLMPDEIDLEMPCTQLSLSERQLVTVARALVRDPKVLILDESTSALDLNATKAVVRELKRIRDAGVCVFLVTHRIAELSVLADRATVLRDGRTVGMLTREEFSEQRVLELMTGQPDGVISGDYTRVIDEARVGPVVLNVEDARLEEDSDPFSLQLHEGEIVGLTGLEGHGQVELIRALAQIKPLHGGAVHLVSGQDQASVAEPGSEIAYVSGDRKAEGIFPDLSILENFALPAYRRFSRAGLIDRKRVNRTFAAYREKLKIRLGRSSQPITALSGGNQQKVLLARWLAMEPRVLLLNDPTLGVDIGTKRDVYQVLRELAYERGTGVVFVSTEIESLIGLCDRIVVFREGTIFAELDGSSTVDEVLAKMFGLEGVETGLDVAASLRSSMDDEIEAET